MVMKLVGYEQAFWQSRVSAAFRTGWACFLVGILMQYSNLHNQWMPFPVFAYVMAVTVVGESTLGEAWRGAYAAFLGIIQGVSPTIVVLWLIGPARFCLWITTLCVTVSSFIIAFPETPHITSKRVAFAQSVIIYISAFTLRENLHPFKYPLRVAATTAIGTGCAVISLILPIPRLACYEVQGKSKVSAGITSDLLKLLVGAFRSNDHAKANSLCCQAKSLSRAGIGILKQMEDKQGDINWEIVGRLGFVSPSLKVWTMEFKKLRQSLVGMEMAMKLSSPSQIGDPLHKLVSDPLNYLTEWSSLVLRHAAGSGGILSPAILDQGKQALLSFHEAVSVVINTTEVYQKNGDDFGNNPTDMKRYFQYHLPIFFFLFTSNMFFKDTMDILSQYGCPTSRQADGHEIYCPTIKSTNTAANTAAVSLIQGQERPEHRAVSWQLLLNRLMISKLVDRHRLIIALKCSLALGLSVLFGLLFSNERGHWAGIAVAINMGSSREATFRLANVRAQGTVAGSVYGIIACILTQRSMLLRAVALVPWVVFTSFLRQSEMYGYAGGVSAFTAAVVILGRKNADPPSQFAIVRITETFIGMACYIILELALQPRRASNLARKELTLSLSMLQITINSLVLPLPENNSHAHPWPFADLANLRQNQSRLRDRIFRLKAFMEEASVEPDLWFHPFSGNTYSKLLENLNNMADYIHFAMRALETVAAIPNNFPQQVPMELILEPITCNLHAFRVHVISVLQCVVRVLEIKSLAEAGRNHCRTQSPGDHCQLSGKLHKGFATTDLEGAEADTISNLKHQNLSDTQMNAAAEKVIVSLAETFQQAMAGACIAEADIHDRHHYNSELLLSLSALAFTVEGMMKETMALQKSVQGLLQWENPWSLINVWDIYRLTLSNRDVQRHPNS